jgi:NTE family protein
MAETPPPTVTTTTTKFLADPDRSGSALCLSGGGYRAALFHLGAARRLFELGILANLNAVSSVSGGSIFAAFLAMKLQQNGGKIVDYSKDIADPFRALVKIDIRTTPALKRLLPWEWFNGGAQSQALQEEYEKHLCPGKKLKDLPVQPRFHFCATDMSFGVNWIFTRDKVGNYQAGYMQPPDSGEIPLAQAVAASSCFPPVFKPMPMALDPDKFSLRGKMDPGDERNACIRSIALTDGGVYDNMGLEPVWKSCQTLLVSDGGKPFQFTKHADTPHQLLRFTDIQGNQAEAVRKRWLIDSYVRKIYDGSYWGIKSCVENYELDNAVGYSEKLADEVISEIRTDMDAFSDPEICVLETHGYTLADAAVRKHVPQLHNGALLKSWCQPQCKFWPDPANLPTVEDTIRQDLANSSHVKIFH